MDNVTDAELLADYKVALDVLKATRESAGRLEYEIIKRAKEKGARVMLGDNGLSVNLDYGTPAVDYNVLAQLRERIPPETIAEGCTPEHEETITVPEKWNMTTVNKWAAFGSEEAEIIKRAKLYGRPKLKIVEKE